MERVSKIFFKVPTHTENTTMFILSWAWGHTAMNGREGNGSGQWGLGRKGRKEEQKFVSQFPFLCQLELCSFRGALQERVRPLSLLTTNHYRSQLGDLPLNLRTGPHHCLSTEEPSWKYKRFLKLDFKMLGVRTAQTGISLEAWRTEVWGEELGGTSKVIVHMYEILKN